MPPLVLFHPQTFLSSENTTSPAAISSPMWRALDPKNLGGRHSAVPGDDLVVANQDGVSEAEPLYTLGNLPDLLLRVSAGVFRVRPQLRYRHRFADHGAHVLTPAL